MVTATARAHEGARADQIQNVIVDEVQARRRVCPRGLNRIETVVSVCDLATRVREFVGQNLGVFDVGHPI